MSNRITPDIDPNLESLMEDAAVVKSIRRHIMKGQDRSLPYRQRLYDAVEGVLGYVKRYEETYLK